MTFSSENLLKRLLLWMVLLYAVNFLVLGFLVGPFDYDHLSGYYEIAWRFWRSGGGLPQFNPYLCGGRTLGGDPQIPIFSPLPFLVPLMGATWLIKIELVLQLLLGVYGLRGWLRILKAPPNGIRWATLVYIAGGGVVSRFLVGHVTMGFFLLMPLFFYLSYRIDEASGESPGKVKVRLIVAYFALFGYAGFYKPNFLIHFVPIVVVEHLARAWGKRRPGILLWFVAAVGFSTLVSCVTWLPAWRYFLDFPRSLPPEDFFFPPYTWFLNLVMPLRSIPNNLYGEHFLPRHEFSLFVTPVALVFAWWGIKKWDKNRPAELRALLIFFCFSLLLGVGTLSGKASWLFPYTWFRQYWPGFSSIRAPVRFWYGTYLTLVVLSGLGWRDPVKKGWKWVFILFGLLPLVGSSTVLLCRTTYGVTRVDWNPPPEYPKDVIWVQGGPDDSYFYLRQGKGVIDCLYNLETYPSPSLREGNELAYRSDIAGDFGFRWLSWNRIAVDINANAPFTVSLNLNHSPYWHFEGDGKITSALKSPLTLTSPGKSLHGILTYHQPLVRLSLLLSTASLLAFAIVSILLWRRAE